MKKGFKSYVICWAMLLVLFNLICFATPAEWYGFNKFGGAFWAGYIVIMLAFIGQLVCAQKAFRAENAKKFFYHLPLITVSYTGLILTLVLGGLCMAIPNVPNWLGAILGAVVLALTAVAVIKASAAAEIVESVDKKVAEKTAFLRMTTANADVILASVKSAETKAECRKVYEALRYSDPMSNEALSVVEAKITVKLNELKAAAAADDAETVKSAAKEAVLLIKERNAKCKVLK